MRPGTPVAAFGIDFVGRVWQEIEEASPRLGWLVLVHVPRITLSVWVQAASHDGLGWILDGWKQICTVTMGRCHVSWYCVNVHVWQCMYVAKSNFNSKNLVHVVSGSIVWVYVNGIVVFSCHIGAVIMVMCVNILKTWSQSNSGSRSGFWLQ